MPLGGGSRPPRPAAVVCPHCGRRAVRPAGDHQCADCGMDDRTERSAPRSVVARAAAPWRNLRLSPPVLIALAIMAPSIVGAVVFLRAHGKSVTADRMRSIKKLLEIHEVEVGGYPASLDALDRRHGPVPPQFRVDGWDRPIAYTVSGPLPPRPDEPGPLFAECELRSAGPNGRSGDDDDLVWRGKSSP